MAARTLFIAAMLGSFEAHDRVPAYFREVEGGFRNVHDLDLIVPARATYERFTVAEQQRGGDPVKVGEMRMKHGGAPMQMCGGETIRFQPGDLFVDNEGLT